jgi:hypothetical protein
VIGLVAAVVVAGVIGTGVLILLLRPNTSTAPPERTPVTLRSPETAANAVATTVVTPVETMAVAPSTTVPLPALTTAPAARPSPSPVSRRTVSSAVTPAQVAEGTAPPVAPPTTLPAVTEPARPVTPSFPGAGRVELGEKFYEKTLAYEEGQPLSFEGHVGPLKADKVQFSVGEKKGRFGKVDDLKTEMRAVIPVLDCPKGAGEWDYKLIVELLDESGRRLDKLEGGGSCENEIKTIAASRGVLKSLVGAIRGVKIRLEAAKD